MVSFTLSGLVISIPFWLLIAFVPDGRFLIKFLLSADGIAMILSWFDPVEVKQVIKLRSPESKTSASEELT